MPNYKVIVETVDDVPHMLGDLTRTDRQQALSIFDLIRRSVQKSFTEGGSSHVRNVILVTDSEEDSAGWRSSDPEFPWIIDGESYDSPREHPVPCIMCGWRRRGGSFEPVMMTWNSSAICYKH